ncbi:unnamed protein product [Zymoseptoria tritici ST99CH_1A5]|uniref:DUF4440 domain-containing protein n=3 Tax=Zymoseptoria tritici TaxID=1047171 RepID=F9XAB7_ZYMTI|nr:uncharacterized protein MYCGRDRAFT_109261 [Zymoseptoria tritici IPO323]EGP88257.1 hypothetical protein MYCGRDRAFT_109261 [Zymoseptoria tritici IPO323]SMR51203.1 unnamed protein product [Zymoseptoria tritici ST99CH_1E4]SMR52224.1 unnamed protein product [Zymoseptoria tritici ST99CH_3D1]SMY23897.1 unnamed protein product [Zymoseptoria tritici ST99CH_1A5]
MPKEKVFLGEGLEPSSEKADTETTRYLEDLSRQMVNALNERQYDHPVFKHFTEVTSKLDTKSGSGSLSDRLEEQKRVTTSNPGYRILIKDTSSFINATEDVVEVLLVVEITEGVGMAGESIGVFKWMKQKSNDMWKCKETTYMRGHPAV